MQKWVAHNDSVKSLGISPDGEALVETSSSPNSTTKLWDPTTDKP